MLARLIVLFVVVPLAELALLVYLGTVVGPWYTILVVVATGLVGAALARSQGLATLARIRGNVERGILPPEDILDGALILLGGLLLVTPGLITDALGLLLMAPGFRRWVGSKIRESLRHRIASGEVQYWRVG